jgi:hypothetical protein
MLTLNVMAESFPKAGNTKSSTYSVPSSHVIDTHCTHTYVGEILLQADGNGALRYATAPHYIM